MPGQGLRSGTGVIGSVPLSAGAGTYVRQLDSCPAGVIDGLTVLFKFSVQQTAGSAGGFALSISTLPMKPEGTSIAGGADDGDTIMSAMVTNMSLRADDTFWPFQNLTMPQYRTVLAGLNFQDYWGQLNGFAIPAGNASTSLYVPVIIPFALQQRFLDSPILAQGSDRIKQGEFDINMIATTNPAITLTNGTLDITATSIVLYAFGHPGASSQVGYMWQVERPTNLQNTFERPAHARIFSADVNPPLTNPVPEGGYTIDGQSSATLVGPQTLAAQYNTEEVPNGGNTIATRCTPLMFLGRHAKVGNMPVPLPLNVSAPVASTMTIYDVYLVPPTASTVQSIASKAAGGAGAPVAVSHPTSPSLPVGHPVGAAAANWLPKVYGPQQVAPAGSVTHSNSVTAASSAIANTTASKLRALVGSKA